MAAFLAITSSDPSAPIPSELTNDAAFADDLASFEAAAANLVYSLPQEPMAANLKSRLFERIAPAPSAASADLFTLLSLSIAELKQQAEQLAWEPLPVMAGASIATWKVDTEKRETAFFLRAPIPGQFPKHHHASGEVILVLEGDLAVDDRVYLPGERINSEPDTSHAPYTPHGCLIFCIASLDNQFED